MVYNYLLKQTGQKWQVHPLKKVLRHLHCVLNADATYFIISLIFNILLKMYFYYH